MSIISDLNRHTISPDGKPEFGRKIIMSKSKNAEEQYTRIAEVRVTM
jgi:hypothetical protein